MLRKREERNKPKGMIVRIKKRESFTMMVTMTITMITLLGTVKSSLIGMKSIHLSVEDLLDRYVVHYLTSFVHLLLVFRAAS